MQKIILTGLFLLFVAKSSTSQGSKINLSNCGPENGCLSFPKSCNEQTCNFAVSIQRKDDTTALVNLMGKVNQGPSYVAVGFSKDNLMGEDAVVACLSTGVQTFINPGGHTAAEKTTWKSGGLTSPSLRSAGDHISCSFVLPMKIDASSDISFDLSKDPINLLLASGPATGGNQIQKHTVKEFGTISPLAPALSPRDTSSAGDPTGPPPTGPTTPASTSTTQSKGISSMTLSMSHQFILFIGTMLFSVFI